MAVLKRKLYGKMKKWKDTFHGTSALMVEGARRVGKTTLAETFDRQEYQSYILIDFSACDSEVTDLFRDVSDLDYIFLYLQLIYNVKLVERKSVIIFDEVQLAPYARQAIKKLVKDGRYDYIETGSLISIRKNIENIRIPSEETRLKLYPLDFEEFLWAIGKDNTVPLLRKLYRQKVEAVNSVMASKSLPSFQQVQAADLGTELDRQHSFQQEQTEGVVDTVSLQSSRSSSPRSSYSQYRQKAQSVDPMHRNIMRDFHVYMLVGGMPEAVMTYLKTNNMQEVDQVKREILTLYEEELLKLDPGGKAWMLLKQIPGQLQSGALRYQVSQAIPNGRAERLAEILFEMEQSMFISIASHAENPSAGLFQSPFDNRFKMYLLDTGLLVSLAFWKQEFKDNEIYRKLLCEQLPVNLGYLYKNAVAQALVSVGQRLFYYTFPKENSHKNYEIDFLLSQGEFIHSILVKCSGYKTYAAFDTLTRKFSCQSSSKIGMKYLVYIKDLDVDQDVLCLPVYMLTVI